VTQTDNASPQPQALSRPAQIAWLLVVLASLYICYFHNLGAIGLVGPDEPRYAWIARAMAESGDWVTPRLYGKPWFEKPVLYYWGAAASFKLFGVSEVTARLPSAVAALLATLALAWLALRLYGAETARWLLLLLSTTVGMIGFSHAAATDMLFAAMLTIAMVFAVHLVGLVPKSTSSNSFTSFDPSASLTFLFFGFFLGLAVLAKGPAAIVLSGGAVLLWAIFTKRWRDAFLCFHPLAITSFCLTALPWYILCARRNPDFFRIFIIEHNFKRYLTPEFQHIQPFWFYVPILLIAFAPWTLILLWGAVYGAVQSRSKQSISPTTLFPFCWALFCIVFFSISKSKLPGYVLPAVLPIGLLLTRSYIAFRDNAYFRWLLVGFAGLSVPVSLVLFVMGWRIRAHGTSGVAVIVVGCVLLLFALANFVLTIRRSDQQPVFDPALLCTVPVLLILLMFPTFSRPWLRWDPSGKTLAADIRANQIPPDQVFVAHMPRGQQFSLSFYLHQEIQDWNVDSPKEGYLLLNSKECSDDVNPHWKCEDQHIRLGAGGWFLYHVHETQ
jgi:4-amino-4-deoxy-L-arabinose transferase-like glycosyltransferase